MEGKRFLHKLRLSGLLSFDAEGVEVELGPLNVLIGPNASGKSNLIEAIGLLKAAPTDLLGAIGKAGGVQEWLWKGAPPENTTARIEATAALPDTDGGPLRYLLSFTSAGTRLRLIYEAIDRPTEGATAEKYVYVYDADSSGAEVSEVDQAHGVIGKRSKYQIHDSKLDVARSILSQLKDPERLPEITSLAKHLGQVRIFSDWRLDRHAPMRTPQPADLPGDFLEEDASNLSLVVNDLLKRPAVKQTLLTMLQQVYEDLTEVTTQDTGGMVQILFHQEGLVSPIPASRASDGTLRFLSLLTILCHPSPPPLICIEEPELGLHMDMLPTIAELMVDAAQRTQLVVTTHSDIFIDALTDTPEAVIVCERDQFGTRLHSVDPEDVKAFIGDGFLGDLWSSGHLGGRRW